MPVLAFLAVAVAVTLYGYLCYLAVVYVLVPLAPWAVLLGVVAGAGLVVVVLAAGLLGARSVVAPTVTPAQARRRLPEVASPRGRDGAWANYLFAQAQDDLAATARAGRTVLETVWTSAVRPFRENPWALTLWPLLLLPAIVLVLGSVSAVVAGIAVYGVLGVVLGLTWLGWAGTAGALRGADLGVRTLRRAKATCPSCNHRSTLPGYRCPCSVVHYDIRAGRQGLFLRRCECGRRLPTTVLQAAAGLVAVCPRCAHELHAGSAVLTDVVLPVCGPVSAGKTRLVYAGMAALGRHLAAGGGTLRAADTASERMLDDAEKTLRRKEKTVKTAAGAPPASISVRLTSGKRKALLHVFDAAGEFYATRDQASMLPFLNDVQGLVFVLDPFSVPAFAARLRGGLGPELAAADPARQDPEDAYRVPALWLRDQGRDITKIPLAVAVVKADLLHALPSAVGVPGPSAGSADVRQWLVHNDMENLVTEMERDFREVGYHLVSSWDTGTDARGRAGPLSAAQPLLWLLQRSTVPVAEPVVTS